MKRWLVLMSLGWPVWAQTTIPSLDDYALPRVAGTPTGQVTYQVQSPDPIALRSNERISVPIWDSQRVILGQLNGTFIPEGEVAGRLVFDELRTAQGTVPISAQTDLLPAQGIASIAPPAPVPSNYNNNYNNYNNNYSNPYNSMFGMGRGRRRGFGRGGGGLGGLNSLSRRSSLYGSNPYPQTPSYPQTLAAQDQVQPPTRLTGQLQPGQFLTVTFAERPQ